MDLMKSDADAIAQARDLGLAAFNANDIEGFLSSWVADDAIFMLPNEPPVEGKRAVGIWLRHLYEQFDVHQTVVSEELVISGDWAFDRLTVSQSFLPKSGGGVIHDVGKAIDIYRRQADGSWKVARTIVNSNSSMLSAAVAHFRGLS